MENVLEIAHHLLLQRKGWIMEDRMMQEKRKIFLCHENSWCRVTRSADPLLCCVPKYDGSWIELLMSVSLHLYISQISIGGKISIRG